MPLISLWVKSAHRLLFLISMFAYLIHLVLCLVFLICKNTRQKIIDNPAMKVVK